MTKQMAKQCISFIIQNSRGAQGLSSGPALTGQLAIMRGLEGGPVSFHPDHGHDGGHVEFKGDDPRFCCCFSQEFIPTTKDQCFAPAASQQRLFPL